MQKKKREATVLLPLIEKGGELFILFKCRTPSLRHQPGDIVLPGGGIEDGRTPLEATLCEMREELLVSDDRLTILGEIGTGSSPAGQKVYVPATELKDYRGISSLAEADRALTLPLSFFLIHCIEHRRGSFTTRPVKSFPYDRIEGGKDYPSAVRNYTIPVYPDIASLIWDMTARMLERPVERLLGRDATM